MFSHEPSINGTSTSWVLVRITRAHGQGLARTKCFINVCCDYSHAGFVDPAILFPSSVYSLECQRPGLCFRQHRPAQWGSLSLNPHPGLLLLTPTSPSATLTAICTPVALTDHLPSVLISSLCTTERHSLVASQASGPLSCCRPGHSCSGCRLGWGRICPARVNSSFLSDPNPLTQRHAAISKDLSLPCVA